MCIRDRDYLMDYKKDWKGESPSRKLDRYAAKAAAAEYAALKQAHISPVSYTHLDVYKRQVHKRPSVTTIRRLPGLHGTRLSGK